MQKDRESRLHLAQTRFILEKPRLRCHKKVRTGCATCKSRWIKCPEQKPSCTKCLRIGAVCSYETTAADSRSTNLKQTSQLPDTIPCSLSCSENMKAGDLKLLHHFRLYVWPDCLLGPEGAWVAEITKRANQYPHMMHSMPALSGSHLGALQQTLNPVNALMHRAKSLQALSNALLSDKQPNIIDLEASHYGSTSGASFLYDMRVLGFYSTPARLRSRFECSSAPCLSVAPAYQPRYISNSYF